jgi:hypothetical protein
MSKCPINRIDDARRALFVREQTAWSRVRFILSMMAYAFDEENGFSKDENTKMQSRMQNELLALSRELREISLARCRIDRAVRESLEDVQ